MRYSTIWGLFVLLAAWPQWAPAQDGDPLMRIAFGSCAKQDKPQPIWDAVVATKPQLFLFLGDNIYGDSEDMDVLRSKYRQLGDQPGFRKLKATCPLLATWDDHDFGANDAGSEYPKKRESQKVFVEFFGEQDDSSSGREGVYSARVIERAGRRVQVVLLDTRYFRSPLKKGFENGEPGEGRRGIYSADAEPGATLLGEAQWEWLERQLQLPADLRIIGSSIQFIADEHGSEMWGNFPHERTRMLRLLRQSGAAGVVFISGDRHLAEISRLVPGDVGPDYPLFDVTSSSLNAPSGNFTKAGTRFANEINSYRVGLTYFDTNFGSIVIDWQKPDPVVRLQVRDEKGDVVLQQRVALSQLRPPR